MKTIAIVLLLALPGSVGAVSLHDDSELYVQTNIDVGVDLYGSATTSDDTSTNARATTSANVNVGGIRAAVDVATVADLAAYGESLETSDEHIDRVEATVAGDVMLSYYHPVRLFGIFPIRAKAETTVSVNESGMIEVDTKLPWWCFMASGAAAVATSVDAELANSGSITTDMKLTGNAAARARVLEAVANAHVQAMVRAATQ